MLFIIIFNFLNIASLNFDLDSVDVIPTDPDILFIFWGGFVHYNVYGVVLNTMTLSRYDQQYFLQYTPPEQLHEDDIKRYITIVSLIIDFFIFLSY